MLTFPRGSALSALVFVVASALPAGSNSQAGPGGTALRCRTYPSAYRLVTTSSGVTSTVDGTCRSTNRPLKGRASIATGT